MNIAEPTSCAEPGCYGVMISRYGSPLKMCSFCGIMFRWVPRHRHMRTMRRHRQRRMERHIKKHGWVTIESYAGDNEVFALRRVK